MLKPFAQQQAARFIELNRDAAEAAARLVMRAGQLKPPANKPEHYLMAKHLSRIAHGQHRGERGYDPNQHQQYWDTAWHSLTKEAGLEGLRFHDLRHTFITHMVELGVPLGVIQTFVGHMSARMVRHYTIPIQSSHPLRCNRPKRKSRESIGP